VNARQAQVDRAFLFLLRIDGVIDSSGNPRFFSLTHMTCAGPPGATKVQQFRRNGSSR
jgi:hypothetical protein